MGLEESNLDGKSELKCARCGGPLTEGYVMAPKGLWWDIEPHKNALIVGVGMGEKIVTQWSFRVPIAPAQRCYKCNVVIIQVQ